MKPKKMSIFSYHLVQTTYFTALRALLFPLKSKDVAGLIHAECMTSMTLGSPIFSTSRMKIKQLAVFAQWESEDALILFIQNHELGKTLAKGWHVRLLFLRQWGTISGFEINEEQIEIDSVNEPVVAVTIARMKLFEVPRFIYWGRPVEKLVRDHLGTLLSSASIRLPRTVSTFSVWKSLNEMTDMVRGHSAVPMPKRHLDAMKERDRKDFHFEFTTLRFKPISEYGAWDGRRNIIKLQ